ncbi:MAG TPA: adenosylcobinamide-GDP ribazoletransferase [Actinophytocola sp.]|uniref:adenosylcobinamide-GDP ribazoletransferase n=1 Tax=Actinophytocola sp. TaxID=1872138 RepID=UPI002DB93DE6|nr:adenosylcobinamide-GDP ribazoletransferase [Actinophytocola sp.]HEU5473952.1 adenosylcobinamide-GDP ribazoletransferase [Actinophytocola sp.]
MRLALSWLTVLPVGPVQVDAAAGRRAIMLAPLVGLLLGAAAALALFVADQAGMPGLVAGLLTVGMLAGLTRGMHLDGLADTADGFGCYGPPERALAVMRDGGAGPFAVVTLIVVLGTQASAFGALGGGERWAAVPVALVAGRAAFGLCCLPGTPAARPDGLGALVAGSQPAGVVAGWWALLAVAGGVATLPHWWLGLFGVPVAAGAVLLLVWHARRRLGGITGDVLGAACETAVTTVLVVCTLA